MVCPVCGSDEAVILKNKLIKGKNKEIREFLLKCDECGSVYNERISQDNPKPFRLIISEHEDTHKIFIDLFPDDVEEILHLRKGTLDVEETKPRIVRLKLL